MDYPDPKIKITDAIKQAGGTQAALSRALGVSRAYVCIMVKSGERYLPPLWAYRFREMYFTEMYNFNMGSNITLGDIARIACSKPYKATTVRKV